MKKGLLIHVERLLEAEHKDATLNKVYNKFFEVDSMLKERDQERNELTKCIFVHSFRCERYKTALEKQEK